MATDVIVIGGGVIGLSIARELALDHSVSLIERGRCGQEASSAAAGMLGAQAEAYGDDLFFRTCVESREMFPALAASLLDETGIDVGLDLAGTLLLSFSEADITARSQRFAWQKAAGFEIDKAAIRMPDGPLKAIGEFPLDVALHTDVVAQITVKVTGEQ